MDLANMIVDASAEALKKEYASKGLTLDMSFSIYDQQVLRVGEECNYALSVVPISSSQLMIKYKALEYKVARYDEAAFTATIDFLLMAIKAEYWSLYSGGVRGRFASGTLQVIFRGEKLFTARPDGCELMDVVAKRYLLGLKSQI